MYVDPKQVSTEGKGQRIKEIAALAIIVVFISFEYRAVHDLLVRLTRTLVATETEEIRYESSALGFWSSPTVEYQWKGVDYQKPVGGLFLANSAAIIPPVKILVDPQDPQVSILKTPYGGWGAWALDFVLLQALVAGFVYWFFIGPHRVRKKSYFQ